MASLRAAVSCECVFDDGRRKNRATLKVDTFDLPRRVGILKRRHRDRCRSCRTTPASDRGLFGRPRMSGLLEGFKFARVRTSGAEIALSYAGKGPPLLLMHGNPFTHVTWHKIAPRLTEEFTV